MQDIIIIGSGIAGLSVAAELSVSASVTVLEQESSIGYHASGRSAALFEANYGAPSTIELNKASLDHHKSANVLSARGLMVVGDGDDATFETDLTSMQMEEVSLDQARTLFPILGPGITRAAYTADTWDIDTDLLLQGFAKTLRAHGGTIQTKAPVTDITRTPDGWRITAGGADIQGRMVVNAAGAWADPVAQMAGIDPIGIQPLRRSMARIPCPDGMDPATWPMVLGAGETWYCKPDAGAIIVSPADAEPVSPHDAWADDMVLAEGLASFEAATTAEVTRLLSSWAGLRSFAPDRNLVLGRSHMDDAFVWCAGQGGYGMQSAPGTAKLLADLINGRQPDHPQWVVDAVHAARFA